MRIKIHHHSCLLCVTSMLAAFDTVSTCPALSLLAWNTQASAHCHSAQHTHAHHFWPHPAIAAILLTTTRRRCFYPGYCWRNHHTRTFCVHAQLWNGKWWPCDWEVYSYLCVTANCCVFSGELISVGATLKPAGQVWQTTTVCSLIIGHITPCSLKAEWTVGWNMVIYSS